MSNRKSLSHALRFCALISGTVFTGFHIQIRTQSYALS